VDNLGSYVRDFADVVAHRERSDSNAHGWLCTGSVKEWEDIMPEVGSGPDVRRLIGKDGSPSPLDFGDELPKDAYPYLFKVPPEILTSISSNVAKETAGTSSSSVVKTMVEEKFRPRAGNFEGDRMRRVKSFVGKGKWPIRVDLQPTSVRDLCQLYLYGELENKFDAVLSEEKKPSKHPITHTYKYTAAESTATTWGASASAPLVSSDLPPYAATKEKKRQRGSELAVDFEHDYLADVYLAKVRLHGVLVIQKSGESLTATEQPEPYVKQIKIEQKPKIFMKYYSSEAGKKDSSASSAAQGGEVAGDNAVTLVDERRADSSTDFLALVDERGKALPMTVGVKLPGDVDVRRIDSSPDIFEDVARVVYDVERRYRGAVAPKISPMRSTRNWELIKNALSHKMLLMGVQSFAGRGKSPMAIRLDTMFSLLSDFTLYVYGELGSPVKKKEKVDEKTTVTEKINEERSRTVKWWLLSKLPGIGGYEYSRKRTSEEGEKEEYPAEGPLYASSVRLVGVLVFHPTDRRSVPGYTMSVNIGKDPIYMEFVSTHLDAKEKRVKQESDVRASSTPYGLDAEVEAENDWAERMVSQGGE
jgi:hypothetical protein